MQIVYSYCYIKLLLILLLVYCILINVLISGNIDNLVVGIIFIKIENIIMKASKSLQRCSKIKHLKFQLPISIIFIRSSWTYSRYCFWHRRNPLITRITLNPSITQFHKFHWTITTRIKLIRTTREDSCSSEDSREFWTKK